VLCRVALDRGGYVPGETIGITALVHNRSKVTIKFTKASLTEVFVGTKLFELYIIVRANSKYTKLAWNCLFVRPLYFRTAPTSFSFGLCVYFAKINSAYAYIYSRFRFLTRSRKLLQTIQYLARSKVVQAETRELASLTRGKIKPGEKDEWLNEQLYVPPLPPTNLRGCNLIRIQYDVYVRAQTQRLHYALFFSRLSSCV
jgi:Arrestin (or S-antigen), C-terminal domain